METPPVTTAPAIAGIIEAVKTDAQDELAKLIATVRAELEPEQNLRNVEMALWRQHVVVGRTLLALRLAEECRRCTERDLEARGLSWEDVQVRVDRDYWVRITTTFGPVYIPLFAYRERRAGVSVTRAPARRLFRLYPRCRSSELLLEWEARLGKEFPFRQAEQMLSFFTHEAAALEDTTIAAHMTAIGQMVDPSWLYRSPEQIRTTLRERATRDAENGRPLIYFSTDAHALRRWA
jgi:hypothetical protein